jgi:Group II intron, maturase-specific domain
MKQPASERQTTTGVATACKIERRRLRFRGPGCRDGRNEQAEALLDQLVGRVEAFGLQLKPDKTALTHIDEGLLFLGQLIVRRPKGPKRYVYTFVSNEALASVRRKVKALTGRSTTNLELSELIAALNPVLRGWGNYFRHAAAKRTLEYLGYYAWWRVGRWLRKKHPRLTWRQIQRRYTSEGTFPPRSHPAWCTRRCVSRSGTPAISRARITRATWLPLRAGSGSGRGTSKPDDKDQSLRW